MFGFIILYLGVDVHRHFAVLMPGQVLNGFWIDRGINEVRNVCVAKLVRGHMEVQTIHMVRGAFSMASENGAGRITDVFPIHILVVDFLSCGVVLNMVPNSHKFALRKGATLTI